MSAALIAVRRSSRYGCLTERRVWPFLFVRGRWDVDLFPAWGLFQAEVGVVVAGVVLVHVDVALRATVQPLCRQLTCTTSAPMMTP